jgi:hypothetical protein
MCVQENVTYIETEAVTSEKWTCYPDSKPTNICSYSLLLLLLATVLSVLRFTDYDWPLVSSNSSVLLLIEAALFSGEATNTNFIVFELTRPEFELEARTLTITPQIWFAECIRK